MAIAEAMAEMGLIEQKPRCVDGSAVHPYVKVSGPEGSDRILTNTCRICGKSWQQRAFPWPEDGSIDLNKLATLAKVQKKVSRGRRGGLNRKTIAARHKVYQDNRNEIIALYKRHQDLNPRRSLKATTDDLVGCGIEITTSTLCNLLVNWKVKQRRKRKLV